MSSDSPTDISAFETLKARQREVRDGFPENLGLRIHRSISWIQRAEKETSDHDAAFIFYWIAFNAAYAEDLQETIPTGERSTFDGYFRKILELDSDHKIYDAIWDKFSQSIRLLLNNRYVFQPFWNFQNDVHGYEDWEERFAKSKRHIEAALRDRDTRTILTTLFDRLYVLRNQLVHGGATWNSAVNRTQVGDGARIISFLLPIFIDLMMDNPEIVWGAPYYPVVE